jgi:hypothetical protein
MFLSGIEMWRSGTGKNSPNQIKNKTVMKRGFLLSGIAVSLLMTATGMHVFAQDNDRPWHVTVYNSDTVETASFNVEALEDIALSTDGATVTFKLDNGKQFPYQTATALFGFEPRSKGSDTANGMVQINPWSVSYANGILHLSETSSSDGNIYNMAGIRIKTFARGQTDIPVNLASGFYIVQSGRNTAKLFVSQNGTGGATITPQPAAATKQAAAYSTITTRAAEVFKTWINITHGDINHIWKTPIQMDLVSYWKFTLDGIEILMKNGNIIIKINDFKGIVFDISPAPPQTDGRDMEKTIKFDGDKFIIIW